MIISLLLSLIKNCLRDLEVFSGDLSLAPAQDLTAVNDDIVRRPRVL